MVLRLLKDHPTQIESDLLDKGLEIGDWYQQTRDERGRLKLSSRRLLDVVLPHLGEQSALNTALREGDWPDWMQMLKAIHNEIAGDNASKRAAPGESAEFSAFLSPKERIERYLETIREDAEEEEATDTFYDELGFS